LTHALYTRTKEDVNDDKVGIPMLRLKKKSQKDLHLVRLRRGGQENLNFLRLWRQKDQDSVLEERLRRDPMAVVRLRRGRHAPLEKRSPMDVIRLRRTMPMVRLKRSPAKTKTKAKVRRPRGVWRRRRILPSGGKAVGQRNRPRRKATLHRPPPPPPMQQPISEAIDVLRLRRG